LKETNNPQHIVNRKRCGYRFNVYIKALCVKITTVPILDFFLSAFDADLLLFINNKCKEMNMRILLIIWKDKQTLMNPITIVRGKWSIWLIPTICKWGFKNCCYLYYPDNSSKCYKKITLWKVDYTIRRNGLIPFASSCFDGKWIYQALRTDILKVRTTFRCNRRLKQGWNWFICNSKTPTI